MLFNSFEYLIFFPVVTLVYFLLPGRFSWVWLLVMSYFFYMNWNAEYALLMAACTVVTYVCARLIERFDEKKPRKRVLVAGIVLNIGMLAYFKYTGMFLDIARRACEFLSIPVSVPRVSILLPVGISFYVFQALSYMFDVYRRRVKPEHNLLKYALFVSFFPQLVAGPIERSGRLLGQVAVPHKFDWQRARDGLLIMLLGYFEKVVIADRAAIYVDMVYGSWVDCSGWQIALATLVFAIQDLCDFAGYSYIAIGSAKVLGIDLMTNFRQPYFAHSVQNFWARWHISLSTWFRDSSYFPLGAGRGAPLKKSLNIITVFTLSGLWHGAALKYVVWGFLNGAIQAVEGLIPPPKPGKRRVPLIVSILWTNVLILITMLIFRAGSFGTAMRMLIKIPMAWGAQAMATGFSAPQAVVLAATSLALFAIELVHEKQYTLTELTDRHCPTIVRGALYLAAVMVIAIFGIWGPGYSAQAFIYFQF